MFKVIVDSREQYAWDFTFYDKCDGIISTKLDTGDYSIEGLETVLTIERKRTTAEIAMNVGKDRKRFNAELERMSKFKYKYLICEFSFETLLRFPQDSGIPRSRWNSLRLSPQYLVSCLNSYKDRYGIDVIYCDNKQDANSKAIEILTDIYEKEMVSKS